MPRLFRAAASFIQSILDVILPRKERVMRTLQYSSDDIVVSPTEQQLHGNAITTLLSYREQSTQDLIRTLKYDRSGVAAQLLADVLAEYLREEIASIHAFSTRHVILAPVPLHASRRHERGFNQVEQVLEQLPIEFKNGILASIVADALRRTRATPPQTHLSRAERLTNVADAFAINNMGAVLQSHVFLIDDVTTTGATLSEAARPLQSLDVDVTLLALARA